MSDLPPHLHCSFRRHLSQLIYDLLVDDQVSHTLIEPLVNIYRELYLDEMAFIDQLVTVISDVRLPMSTEVKQLSEDKQRKVDIKASVGEWSYLELIICGSAGVTERT